VKQEIKNRKGQKVVVLVEEIPGAKGLAFVMHGLGGQKEAPHLQAFTDAFHNNGYSVVRFDTTNTFGESDGDYADATVTNYYEDLEDVIAWAATQSFYREPFILAGHSLGGISTASFAERYPQKVKALAPISTVVSGKLSLESEKYGDESLLKNWKATGWLETPSESTPGRIKRLKWSHMEDRVKYDLLEQVDKLTMPVLMIVGTKDIPTPPAHQKILFDALPGPKEMHVIEGAPHTFREPKHLEEIKAFFDKWIKTLD
jgi:lysophospholipase